MDNQNLVQISEQSFRAGAEFQQKVAEAHTIGYDAGAQDGINVGFAAGMICGGLVMASSVILCTAYAEHREEIHSKIKSVFRKKND